MPRLYVAIELPDEIADQIERLCVGLPDVRWIDRDDLHLTLRFIGEVDHPTYEEVGEALADIMGQPFDIRLEGIGHFPPRGEPTALWIGVSPSDQLQALKRRVDRTLAELGVGPDNRRYAPHVTIARVKGILPENRLGSFLHRLSLYRSEPFPVTGFTLYSSTLRPDGALHVPEATYDFVRGVAERV